MEVKLVDRVREAIRARHYSSAVLFLYRDVLGVDIGPIEHIPRARTPLHA